MVTTCTYCQFQYQEIAFCPRTMYVLSEMLTKNGSRFCKKGSHVTILMQNSAFLVKYELNICVLFILTTSLKGLIFRL